GNFPSQTGHPGVACPPRCLAAEAVCVAGEERGTLGSLSALPPSHCAGLTSK
ncbi:hypothetical protein NDU88_000339, partial [Pleurodeles waltl]